MRTSAQCTQGERPCRARSFVIVRGPRAFEARTCLRLRYSPLHCAMHLVRIYLRQVNGDHTPPPGEPRSQQDPPIVPKSSERGALPRQSEESGRPPIPKKIHVETFLGCNARCTYCTIHEWEREKGPMTA